MTRQHHRKGLTRAAFAAGAALTVVTVAGAAPGADAAVASTPGKPQLKLIAASKSVILDRYEGNSGVYLDLGTYVTVDNAPLELKVTRKSYKDPVVATQILRNGTKTTTRTLPAGTVKDFSGLTGFLEVSIKNAAGVEVRKTQGAFCPGNASGRLRPDAPATSHYPESCSTNPFTLGSVWGVEKGWASNSSTVDYDAPVDLAPGEYTAKVSVAKKYRDLFGIPNDQPTIKVTVRQVSGGEGGGVGLRSSTPSGDHTAHNGGHDMAGMEGMQGMPGMAAGHHHGPRGADAPTPSALSHALESRGLAHLGDGAGHTDGSRIAPALKAAAARPTGRAGAPANVPKPDLRSLPAWDIAVTDGEDGDAPGKDYLAFSANVWNAGPAPLVVDGFRKPGRRTHGLLPVLLRRQGQAGRLHARRHHGVGPAHRPRALALHGLRQLPAARRRPARDRQERQGGVLSRQHGRDRLHGEERQLAPEQHRSVDRLRRAELHLRARGPRRRFR